MNANELLKKLILTIILIIFIGINLDANAYTIYRKETLSRYSDSELIIGEEYNKYGIYLVPNDETESIRTMVVPKYDYLKQVTTGKYILAELRNQYGVIDYYGNIIIPIEWDEIDVLSNYPIAFKVKKNSKYGVINEYNEIEIPVSMDSIFEIEPYYGYGYKLNGYLGLISPSFDIDTDAIFTELSGIDSHHANVCNFNGCGIYKDGKEYFPLIYSWEFVETPKKLNKGYFLTYENYNYGLMDINKNVILNPQYPYFESIKPYGIEIKTNVNGNKLCGIVDINTGKYIIQLIYDKIEYWDNYGYYKVKKNGKWGAINSKGQVILPFTHGPLEINRVIKKHPIDSDYIKTVENNNVNLTLLEYRYYTQNYDSKNAEKVIKKYQKAHSGELPEKILNIINNKNIK